MPAKLIDALHIQFPQASVEEIADLLWLLVQRNRMEAVSSSTLDGAESASRPQHEWPPSQSVRNIETDLPNRQTPLPTAAREETRGVYLPNDVLSDGSSATPNYKNNAGKHRSNLHGAVSFPTPAARALPNQLVLGRILRTLSVRIPSPFEKVLDVDATVQRIADERTWLPQYRPVTEKWLEVALVVDESASMVIWRKTIDELQSLLEYQGAFRTVTRWGIWFDQAIKSSNKTLSLYAGSRYHAESRPPLRSPLELIHPRNRCIILIVSDCVNPAWHNGKMVDLLSLWVDQSMVSLVQVLPEDLWLRTGLGRGIQVLLSSPLPGTPNSRLHRRHRWFTDDDESSDEKQLSEETRSAEKRATDYEGVVLPVTTLEPESLSLWCQSIAGRGHVEIPGTLFSPASKGEPSPLIPLEEKKRRESDPAIPKQQQQVERFFSESSPAARLLARYLAVVPLSLPVMRLVQETMLDDVQQVHLAEVFLSGLIIEPSGQREGLHPDDVRYDFAPGVRDILLSTLLENQVISVLAHTSAYIHQNIGVPNVFQSLIAESEDTKEHIRQLLVDKRSRPFAVVTATVLRMLGGGYASLASRIFEVIQEESADIAVELDDIRELLEKDGFQEAEDRLDVLEKKIVDPAGQQNLRSVWTELRTKKREKLEETIRNAQRLRNSHPHDYKAQKSAWRNVLRLESDNQQAAIEISRLDRLTLSESAYKELSQIRSRMPEIRTRLSAVEDARRRVDQMRYDSPLQFPEIQSEINRLYQELDTIRNDILRASQGGTSMERMQNYDGAIELYRKAIRAGFREIQDEINGEYVDPAVRLRETVAKRNSELISRASERFVDAEQFLKDGMPELALTKLEEALSLLETVESEGGDLRSKVQSKLEEAHISLGNKQKANVFVSESDISSDVRQSRALLLHARDIYPSYPRLAERIRSKEEQLLDRVLVEMSADLGRSRALLNEHTFDEARHWAEQMMRRGAELDFVTREEEFQSTRQQAEELLDNINVAQRDYQRFTERLKSIEAALKIPDVRLARNLLEAIPVEQRRRQEVTAFSLRISQLGSNSDKWQDAQRAFSQSQDYRQVIVLCEGLAQSPQFQREATELLRRAQIRLWSAEAQRSEEREALPEACRLYEQMLELRGVVSSEDAHLLDMAAEALDRTRKQMAQQTRYETRLQDIVELRRQQKWADWRNRLRALQQDASDVMGRAIDEERTFGLTIWLSDALSRVEEIKMRRDEERWRTAYELLHPLYEEGAIDGQSDTYQQVAYHYHQHEAFLRADSRDPRELETRVEHLRLLLGLAEPPAINEKNFLTQAIQLWAQRKAEFAAADAKPAQAVKILEEVLDQYKYELKEDPNIRGQLVRYSLMARDFMRAQMTSEAIGYIPGQADLARSWQQLVNAVKAFSQEQALSAWEAGVSGIADVRRMGASNGLLTQSLNEFSTQLADDLYARISSTTVLITNEAILERVRIYALILQLKPDEPRAKSGVAELADRLSQIGRELIERYRRLSDGQIDPKEEVEQLDTLESEISALVRTGELLDNQQSATTKLLRMTLSQVKERKNALQSYLRLLSEIKDVYGRTLMETWDTAPLESTHVGLQRAARQVGSSRQLEEWDGKVLAVRDVLSEMVSLLDDLERSWLNEAYDRVLKHCEALDSNLRTGRSRLGDRTLIIPDKKIDLFDGQHKVNLKTLDAVRSAAQEKEANLRQWREWITQFNVISKSCADAEQAGRKAMTEKCLSQAKEHGKIYIHGLSRLVEHLQKTPRDALSKAAHEIKQRVEESNHAMRTQEQIALQETRLVEIEESIQSVVEPLNVLRRFMGGRNINMANDANKRTFYNLAVRIEQIDACNPDLLELIGRYERMASEKYQKDKYH